jgi:hypothetical protein
MFQTINTYSKNKCSIRGLKAEVEAKKEKKKQEEE